MILLGLLVSVGCVSNGEVQVEEPKQSQIEQEEQISKIIENQKSKLCDAEVQKRIPNRDILKESCLTVALEYEQKGSYGNASWYYLLGGDYQKNINLLSSKIAQDDNLINIAHSYVLNGNMQEAERLYRYALASYNMDDLKHGTDEDYRLLSTLYPQKKAQLKEGYLLWKRVYADVEKSADAIMRYKQQVANYVAIKDYPNQLVIFQKMLPLYESTFGAEHANVATLYDNISTVYNNIGENSKSLEYAKKGFSLRKKILQSTDIKLAHSYNNVAVSYQIIGNHQKALKLFFKALDIEKKSDAKNKKFEAQLYSSIASSYGMLKVNSKALSFHKKSVELYERLFGTESLETSIAYSNLGGYYVGIKDYANALIYFNKSLNIREKDASTNKLQLFQTYLNLAETYQLLNQEDKALSYALKTIAMSQKMEEIGESVLSSSYNTAGWIYFQKGEYVKAYSYAKKSFDIMLKNRDNYFVQLNAIDKEHYIKDREKIIFLLIESAYLSEDATLTKSVVNDWLRYKGSLFDSENRIASLYHHTANSQIRGKIDKLTEERRRLANYYQSDSKNLKAIGELEDKISTIIKELSVESELDGLDNIEYKMIAEQLKSDELYIDFARIAENYFVFTIDNQGVVSLQFINTKKRERINRAIMSFRKEMKRASKLSSKENLSTLYRLLMKIFVEEPQWRSKKSYIISTDGLLNLLPFETLYMAERKSYLIEEKSIRYIPSGKEFIRLYKNRESHSTEQIVLFSNPNFDSQISSSKRDNRLISSSLQKMRFSKLLGTKKEAEAIKKILHGRDIKEYTQSEATEANLLKVVQPKILHIATHGFFIKSRLPNPMLKSGIALAGANKNIAGVVTALKLSGLNLKGTELVVLSACETGLVNVNSTDSVSGLSKAFIQSGAKDIVVSLWSVSDMGTKEFMKLFYKEIAKEKSYLEALREAKIEMIKQGIPIFIWSPFIMNGV